jgi:hypothetical protein
MATIAMVATAASTTVSMVTMNQAARFAALGEGWVIPMVLMKAFEMRRRSFTFFRCLGFRCWVGAIVAELMGLNRMGGARIYWIKACRSGGRRIHLKMSEKTRRFADVYCCCYP